MTDAEYGSGIKLTLLEPEQRIANRFTLRKMTEEYPVRIENETDTGYTTEYRERKSTARWSTCTWIIFWSTTARR